MYKGCWESNASYFITLAYSVRSRWYGNRGWTFPPIYCSVLLLCDRWQQRGTLTKWHLTWKCVKPRCVIEFSHVEKTASTDIHGHLLNLSGDQTVDVSTVQRWDGLFQQWWQWVTSAGVDFLECDMKALVDHWQKCIANGSCYVEKCFVSENLFYQIALLCSLYCLWFPWK